MRHPESPRFAGALLGLGVIAAAAMFVAVLLLTFGPFAQRAPASSTASAKQKPIASLSNSELVAALGEPYGTLDCQKTLGLQGMTGIAWLDETQGRVVVVCAP